MADIGLVTFTQKGSKNYNKPKGFIKGLISRVCQKAAKILRSAGFFKTSFGTRLFCFTKRKEICKDSELIELTDNIRLQIVRLPMDTGELRDFNAKIIAKMIQKNLEAKNISQCYIPAIAGSFSEYLPYSSIPPCDKILLKLLLDSVLTGVYTKKTGRIGDLDIVITAGENVDEAFSVVSLLESQIKYLTIAVSNKEKITEEMENMLGDLGLSISIVGDCRAAVKNADIVINLASESYLPVKARIKADTIVFNLSKDDISKKFTDNLIINGLVTDLPKHMITRFDKDIFKYYSRKEITELLVSLLLELDSDTAFNCEISNIVKLKLAKYEFRIAGLKGRHGIFKMDALQKLAVGSS